MTSEQAALWSKLAAFTLDASGAAFPFSHRLARENLWPLVFARRVIVEYKRFIFLGAAAGHPVSPSKAVDQAWHLHLTYSKSYWNDLCQGLLQRPFHHEPTQGGAAESLKFDQWYQATLESYRRLFDQSPPSDIWPPRLEPDRLAWVDLNSYWALPKPRLLRRRRK